MSWRSARAGAVGVAVLVAAEIVVASARPALANGFCNTTSPVLDVVDHCLSDGSEFITVPAGAKAVRLRVVGAGGGGGKGLVGGGDGGDGSVFEGWATLPNGTTRLWVEIGAGGSAGVAGAAGSVGGGGGGGGSGVYTADDNSVLSHLVVAGGGGGGGGTDSSSLGYQSVFGNGGNGDEPGLEGGMAGSLTANGGSPGSVSSGAGGTGVLPGHAGQAASPGTVVAGGAGGSSIDLSPRGGAGGGGFAGGGGGAAEQISGNPSFIAGGGGGGGSLTHGVFWDGPSTPTSATQGNGVGGAGAVSYGSSQPGADGEVSMTFIAAPSISTVSPEGGPLAGQNTVTVEGAGLAHATRVEIGGAVCTGLTVVSDVKLTCTAPEAQAGFAAAVSVISPAGMDTEHDVYTYAAEPSVASVNPATGSPAGGATLTITGTDLDSTTKVEIDGEVCPGLGAQHAYVTTSTTVTCVAPAAVNGPGRRDVKVTTLGGSKTLEDGYRYTGPPVIASVLPTVGPQAGGNPLTILGQDLGQVVNVLVGGQVCASVAPTDSTLSCVVPSGASPGKVDVVVSASAGVDIKPSAYEYLPAPTTPPAPTPQPTTSPTPTPTTPTPTTSPPTTPAPTAEPTSPPQLKLALAIRPGAPVRGAAASVSGGGLRANSQYIVTMYSAPVRLASGYADENGTFAATFKLPARACVKGGLHRVVLSGFAPDGTVVSATNWLVFDDTCTTRTVSPAKPATVTYGTFRFDRASARLTPYVKAVLTRTRSTLTSAKQVTITGFTETGSRSEVAKGASKALALKRAQAARDYLRKLGVKAPITVVGAGAVDPLKGRPQSWNRRVFISARY